MPWSAIPRIDLAPYDPRKLSGAEIGRLAEVADRWIAQGLNLPTDFSAIALQAQVAVEHQVPVRMELETDPLSIDAAYVAMSLMMRESRQDVQARRSMAADLRRLADLFERDDVIDVPALPPAQPTSDQEPVSSLPQEHVRATSEQPYVAPEPVPPTPLQGKKDG